MRPHSAGLLIYRVTQGLAEALLVHPGGPYWRHRDRGAWQLSKGLMEPGETAEMAARREAEEELGIRLDGPLMPLGTVRQKGGKVVEAFALEHDLDPRRVAGNSFSMEWPPRSGRLQSFPEIDAARWFALAEAHEWILPSQAPFLWRLAAMLVAPRPSLS